VTPDDLRNSLISLASDLQWTWTYSLRAILDDLPHNGSGYHSSDLHGDAARDWRDLSPLRRIALLSAEQLHELRNNAAFMERVTNALDRMRSVAAGAVTDPAVVYYSPEFGISELLPQYSGGLGILAGDHLKSASDLELSLGAVGLMYRQGFFRQGVDHGAQTERYETYLATDLGATDTGIIVSVPMADREVFAKVWKFDVGRIPLLALDTDLERNSPSDRAITDRLYSGDQRHRLEQELVLGVGGARAVAAMGWKPGLHHLNEGHAGFLILELLDRHWQAGDSVISARDRIRPHVLFTTHTPVPAGIDRFHRDLIDPYLRHWTHTWGVEVDQVAALGADPDDGAGVFNMAALCLGAAEVANGVSQLHGEVSRELFAAVPGGDRITSITNGVHARTWVHPLTQDLFDDHLGGGWDLGDPGAWVHAVKIPDHDLREVRTQTQAPLAALLAERAGVELDPDAVVIGFARRFATYKRATLLLAHRPQLEALLADTSRPVQFVFAGKAHPADMPGKALMSEILNFGGSAAAKSRFNFLVDYDINVARAMYAGCDVWLNTPVRPHEASGTSGEKAALNGALNCSIRDGWWAEMSDGLNGFDIATSQATDPVERDLEESAATLSAIAGILAEFHAPSEGVLGQSATGSVGVPSAEWLERMRNAWVSLGPKVTAARMVSDYQRLLYQPMLNRIGR
jgi:glycogen phosphorylase